MSLDGFIAGANAGPHNPLGDGGERIQDWMFDLASFQEIQGRSGGQTNRDDEVLRERLCSHGSCRAGQTHVRRGRRPMGR
jgi:hypothetical protein